MSDSKSISIKIFLAINKRLLELNMTKIEFAKKIGTSRQNYDRMENEGDLKLSYLQKISDIMGVELAYWFVDDMQKNQFFLESQVNLGSNNTVKQVFVKKEDDFIKQQIEHLQELVKSKDDQIKSKDDVIAIYKEQIEQLKKQIR